MAYTKEQIEEIRRKLLAYSKKDIQLEMADVSSVNPNKDTIVIVKEDGTNKRLPLDSLNRPIWEELK